jgi:hypothetical protein
MTPNVFVLFYDTQAPNVFIVFFEVINELNKLIVIVVLWVVLSEPAQV